LNDSKISEALDSINDNNNTEENKIVRNQDPLQGLIGDLLV
jgi:hypothetical protein